jgi:glycerol kinase
VNEIAQTRADTVFQPQPDRAAVDRQYARWREAVERAKGWNSDFAQ